MVVQCFCRELFECVLSMDNQSETQHFLCPTGNHMKDRTIRLDRDNFETTKRTTSTKTTIMDTMQIVYEIQLFCIGKITIKFRSLQRKAILG